MAIEQRKFEGGDIFINPKDKIINPNAIGKFGYFFLWMDEEIEFSFFFLFSFLGLFLTDSADSLKRAWFYCRKCHANVASEKHVNKCSW